MCADSNRERPPEPHFSPLTPHALEQRESGRPGGGAGRREDVGGSGVYPASLGSDRIPRDAMVRTPAAWGQGPRGGAGYEDSGRSELFMYRGQLLGGLGDDTHARRAGRPDYTGRGPRGWRRSDERIREDVCEALTVHPGIDAGELEVDVQDGVVTLRGAVDDRKTRRLAVDVAEAVAGVRDVHSEIRTGDRAGTRTA